VIGTAEVTAWSSDLTQAADLDKAADAALKRVVDRAKAQATPADIARAIPMRDRDVKRVLEARAIMAALANLRGEKPLRAGATIIFPPRGIMDPLTAAAVSHATGELGMGGTWDDGRLFSFEPDPPTAALVRRDVQKRRAARSFEADPETGVPLMRAAG
jgi:hypothetical protein